MLQSLAVREDGPVEVAVKRDESDQTSSVSNATNVRPTIRTDQSPVSNPRSRRSVRARAYIFLLHLN
jgi:hypothetical protein